MSFIDFTKCSVCNGFYKHLILRDDKLNIIKHISACNRCIKLIEKKRRLESNILDIEYELFANLDINLSPNFCLYPDIFIWFI